VSAIEQVVQLVRSLECEVGRRATHVYVASDVWKKVGEELGDLPNVARAGVWKTRVLGALLCERPELPPGIVIATLKAVD
jgi:hypothetical protein